MGAYSTKQYIVIRKDLKMPKGKIAAQACHASVGALKHCMNKITDETGKNIRWELEHTGVIEDWFDGSFAKVALAVNSEEELKEVYQRAIDNGLPAIYIIDNGTTVFDGVPTATCVGIGPERADILEPLFKDLKLFY